MFILFQNHTFTFTSNDFFSMLIDITGKKVDTVILFKGFYLGDGHLTGNGVTCINRAYEGTCHLLTDKMKLTAKLRG